MKGVGQAVIALVCAVGVVCPLPAQRRLRPPASYVQPTPPSREEGAAILTRSRNIGLSGPYYLEFELKIRPRRGGETILPGRWFGSRTVSGPLTRVEFAPGGDRNIILITHGGARPAAWKGETGGPYRLLEGAELVQPVDGTQISAADLLTPFMRWDDFVYEGLARFRGRPTHVFLLYPPDDEADWYPGIGGARVYIDSAYEAISQAQWLDEAGTPTKTITILDLKKIDEQWIVKSFEVRDERTRDKTRLEVTAAAVQAALPAELFEASGTAGAAGIRIPDELVVRVR